MLTYTVARTVASRVVQTAGKNTSAGKTAPQTQTATGSKPASSGRYYGGINTVNTFADSRRSEQQTGSTPRQAEPRASGAEPAAQPTSAAADRSFVMPGTRRPVNHVSGEQKIAHSDTAGKAGHTVSRSSHAQAGGSSIPPLPPSSIQLLLLLRADTAGAKYCPLCRGYRSAQWGSSRYRRNEPQHSQADCRPHEEYPRQPQRAVSTAPPWRRQRRLRRFSPS